MSICQLDPDQGGIEMKKMIGQQHSLFLVIELLHKLEVLEWEELHLSIAKLHRYVERMKDAGVIK